LKKLRYFKQKYLQNQGYQMIEHVKSIRDWPDSLQLQILLHLLLNNFNKLPMKKTNQIGNFSYMNVLVVGEGGREHAIVHSLQNSSTKKIYVCPGNGGTEYGKSLNINIPLSKEFTELVDFALKNEIDLVIPGPEQLLVDGIQTAFKKGSGP
jgi:hypothetical protein